MTEQLIQAFITQGYVVCCCSYPEGVRVTIKKGSDVRVQEERALEFALLHLWKDHTELQESVKKLREAYAEQGE